MNNTQYEEILIVMMHTSGLGPIFDDYDYFENLDGAGISLFFEGVVRYFNIPRDSHLFAFSNLEFFTTPSSVLEYFVRNKSDVIVPKPSSEI